MCCRYSCNKATPEYNPWPQNGQFPARLLGLPPDRLEVALGLAAHMSCNIAAYTRETEHMTASFLRGGVGARNGVTAALMARVGYDAPPDIFDGEPGFFSSRLGIQHPGPEFLETLGEEYGITGIIFKRQNAGGGNHVAPGWSSSS